MKVRELIEALKRFSGEMPVLTDGYEGGYEEIRNHKSVDVIHEPQKTAYDGEYQDAEVKTAGSIKVVVIGRNRRAD